MKTHSPSSATITGWVAAVMIFSWAYVAHADPQEIDAPLTAADVRALVRIDQLSRWFQEPLTPVQALCIQSEWASPWPADGMAPARERDADGLRRAREKCVVAWPSGAASEPASADSDLRFIAEWRADFLSRARRLQTVKQALTSCIANDARRAVDIACVRRIAGPALPQRDLESLVPALSPKP